MAKIKDCLYLMNDANFFPADFRAKKRIFGLAAAGLTSNFGGATSGTVGIYRVEGAKPLKDDFGEYKIRLNGGLNPQRKYFFELIEDDKGFAVNVYTARFDTTADRWYAGSLQALEPEDYLAIECEVDEKRAWPDLPGDIENAEGVISHADGSYTYPNGVKVPKNCKLYGEDIVLDVSGAYAIDTHTTAYLDGSTETQGIRRWNLPNISATVFPGGDWSVVDNGIISFYTDRAWYTYNDKYYRDKEGQLYTPSGIPALEDNIHFKDVREYFAKKGVFYPKVFNDGGYFSLKDNCLIYENAKVHGLVGKGGDFIITNRITGDYYKYSLDHKYEWFVSHAHYTLDDHGQITHSNGLPVDISSLPVVFFPRTAAEALAAFGFIYDNDNWNHI